MKRLRPLYRSQEFLSRGTHRSSGASGRRYGRTGARKAQNTGAPALGAGMPTRCGGGTGRSSTGNSGRSVRRSRRKRRRVLVTCAAASTLRPPGSRSPGPAGTAGHAPGGRGGASGSARSASPCGRPARRCSWRRGCDPCGPCFSDCPRGQKCSRNEGAAAACSRTCIQHRPAC